MNATAFAPRPVRDLDVICVGGGLAGMVAANRAAQLGARALVLERGSEELYACNSRFAGGVMHIAYENPKAPHDALFAAIGLLSAGHADPALVDSIVQNAARAVEWVRSEGALFARAGNIGWRQWILAPLRPPVTHMEWKGRGADATLRLLERNLVKRDGVVRRGVRALRLLMEDGACRGVVVEAPGGESTLRAANVVLADGGFQGNAALMGAHVTAAPGALKQRGAGTGCGDALLMARAAGAGETAPTSSSTIANMTTAKPSVANSRRNAAWPWCRPTIIRTSSLAPAPRPSS